MACLFGLLMTFMTSSTHAESAIATFNELFGKEVRRVKGTSDAADDIELAGQLVTAARSSQDRLDLLTVLCEQAYNLASKSPAGYDTAEAAMRLLGEQVPAKQKIADAKIVSLFQRGYERSTGDKKKEAGEQYLSFLLNEADLKIRTKDYGAAMQLFQRARPIAVTIRSARKDEVFAKIEYYGVLSKSRQRIAIYEKKIKANPWDKATNTALYDLYLIDMDDPTTASKFMKIVADAKKTKLTPLASKPLESLSDTEALELANWYEDFAKGAIAPAKAPMLTRAKAYTSIFLAKHESQDVQKAAATLALKRIDDALSKVPLPPASGEAYVPMAKGSAGKSIDVLAKVDPTRDKISGDWSRTRKAVKVKRSEASRRFGNFGGRFGGFRGRNSNAQLRLPYTIKGDYILQVKLDRKSVV